MRSLAVLVLVVLAPALGFAADYPCPSDPGFCYRDVGDDGCFDAGTDEGPINDEIEASDDFPAVPPPGTIVCPPSVKELIAQLGSIALATPAGSSILFYDTRIVAEFFETMSGADLLQEGSVLGGVDHLAAGDIVIEGKIVSNQLGVLVESTSGNITIGPKTRLLVGVAVISAPLGDVTFEKNSSVRAKDSFVTIAAGGTVDMTRAKLQNKSSDSNSVTTIDAGEVILRERFSIKSGSKFGSSDVRISATAGDVTIDRLKISTNVPVLISGTNVSIGVPQNGKIPKSQLAQKDAPLEILASDTVDIRRLTLKTQDDAEISTTGTVVHLLDSSLVGKTSPTITVAGGAGSTCDLTGTTVKKATLVTNCDTVVGRSPLAPARRPDRTQAMRVWRVHEYGPPAEVLTLETIPEPDPGPGQVRVRVEAVTINFNDLDGIYGRYATVKPPLPYVPGMEVLGRVDACGPGAEAWQGKRVCSIPDGAFGGYAEAAVCPTAMTFEMPESMPTDEAAAIYFPFHLSALALFERGRLQAGETVLIHAAAGGVGSAAVQLAKDAGATVFATAGSPAKLELCLSLGADRAIDYRADDFAARVLEATDGRGVDVVFDSVGGAVTEASMRCMAFNARLLALGFASGIEAEDDSKLTPRPWLFGNFSFCGVCHAYVDDSLEFKRQTGLNFPSHADGVALHARILDLLGEGRVRPVIGQRVSFEKLPSAFATIERRESVGRSVVLS